MANFLSSRKKMIMLRFFVVVLLMSPLLGEIDIFTMLYLLVQERGMFFHLFKFYLIPFIEFYSFLHYTSFWDFWFWFGLLWFYCKWNDVFNFKFKIVNCWYIGKQ